MLLCGCGGHAAGQVKDTAAGSLAVRLPDLSAGGLKAQWLSPLCDCSGHPASEVRDTLARLLGDGDTGTGRLNGFLNMLLAPLPPAFSARFLTPLSCGPAPPWFLGFSGFLHCSLPRL